ncbi:MAG TPA: MerR family transcriptional regulator [Pyrinomonadaceae bacterium]|jgi:DNA-binding transcriptional MerR regulator
MRRRIEGLRHRKFTGVAELTDCAAKILAESGYVQERGTVTEVPDERTTRYYLAEGLISPAEEKQGTASVFGYLHLLQLLSVKKLQAEHLPIRKIRELAAGRTERELERLLGIEGGGAAKNEAMAYLEKLLMKPTAPSQQNFAPPSPQASAGGGQMRATSAAPQVGYTSLAPGRTVGPVSSSEGAGTWERLEIEPGLELHVHGDYRAPRDTRGLRRLAQLVMRVIESYARRAGK